VGACGGRIRSKSVAGVMVLTSLFFHFLLFSDVVLWVSHKILWERGAT